MPTFMSECSKCIQAVDPTTHDPFCEWVCNDLGSLVLSNFIVPESVPTATFGRVNLSQSGDNGEATEISGPVFG